MRSIDQTSKALYALAKALADNAHRMTEQERESLTYAVFKAIMENENEIGIVNHRQRERRRNGDTLSN